MAPAAEEEDALTGQMGFALRTSERMADGWTWSNRSMIH